LNSELQRSHMPIAGVVRFTIRSLRLGMFKVYRIGVLVLINSYGGGTNYSVGSIAGFAGPYIFGYVYTRTGASFFWGLRFVMAAVLIAGLMILRIPKSSARDQRKSNCDAPVSS